MTPRFFGGVCWRWWLSPCYAVIFDRCNVPLKPMLEKELLWDSLDYGIFTSAYGWFNVFAFMLIIGGIILDKMGVRFTGMGACLLMVLGCGLKYYAISTTFAEEALCLE